MFSRKPLFVSVRFLLVLVGVLCTLQHRVNAVTVAPVYDAYSNTYLTLVGSTSTSSTWTACEAQAQALGGNLITIHSSSENQFVTNTFFKNLTASGGPDLSTAYALWMGLYNPIGISGGEPTKANHAVDFTWVDGETSTYRNWSSTQPDDGNGGTPEFYGGLWGPNASTLTEGGVPSPLGTWNDFTNLYPGPAVPSQGFYGIAQVPAPEPSSTALLITCVSAVLLRRKTATPV